MIQSFDLTGIKEQLPHGAIAQIARTAGVLAPTVSRALNGDKRSPKLPDIIKATADFLTEYRAKEKAAATALNQLLAGNKKSD